MDKNQLYKYAHGDLLENRNTYQYSKYRGPEFILSWENLMRTVLKSLPSTAAPPPPNHEYDSIAEYPLYLSAHFEKLYDGLIRGVNKKTINKSLHLWLKKYEVSKRLYEAYGSDLKPIEGFSYYNFSLYIRFSEILELAYSQSKELYYLNALLKIVDCLVAYAQNLNDSLKPRLSWIISRTLMHVRSLLNES